MANSPEPLPENVVDFRAPPPSPIGTGRRSSVTNAEVLTDFLEHSLRVPDLILPDRVFPRQKSIENPPKIDFQSLNSLEIDGIMDSIAGIGCFQVVNHGIPWDVIRSALIAGAGIFQMSPEKKAVISKSPEKPFGFEEFHGEEEREMSEEFVWCRDESLKMEMEGIWPLGYSNFSDKMEKLLSEIEKVAEKFLLVLKDNSPPRKPTLGNNMIQELAGSTCYLYKHSKSTTEDQWVNSLKYDVIRMLIRGSDYSHALCLHICNGSSEFHVYSKKGWVSFCPDKDALIITVGDQVQAWSGGQYKHVIGRPIYKGEDDDEEDCISMAFLYSPPKVNNKSFNTNKEKTVSLGQQAILAILFTLVYHFLMYIYK